MASNNQVCHCPKHSNLIKKVKKTTWNSFCICAKCCPGITTADAGIYNVKKYIVNVLKVIICVMRKF